MVKKVLFSKEYQTINFSPGDKQYYPASLEEEYEFLREDDSYIKHTEIDIPLGKSRYGGPIIDLPEGLEHPANVRFVAQLDLAEIAKFDKQSRLPTSGQLIFFADIVTDNCHVVYSDTPNNALQRVIDEHDDNFFSGVLIKEMSSATETWQDHFREVDEMELECGECGEEDSETVIVIANTMILLRMKLAAIIKYGMVSRGVISQKCSVFSRTANGLKKK